MQNWAQATAHPLHAPSFIVQDQLTPQPLGKPASAQLLGTSPPQAQGGQSPRPATFCALTPRQLPPHQGNCKADKLKAEQLTSLSYGEP